MSPDSGSNLHKKQQQYHHHHHHHWRGIVVMHSLLPGHWGELQATVALVCGFLFLCLVVSFFLLHHQHRNVILHVLHDPVGHGKALHGRAGMSHLFS
jgi:hypothetical protein